MPASMHIAYILYIHITMRNSFLENLVNHFLEVSATTNQLRSNLLAVSTIPFNKIRAVVLGLLDHLSENYRETLKAGMRGYVIALKELTTWQKQNLQDYFKEFVWIYSYVIPGFCICMPEWWMHFQLNKFSLYIHTRCFNQVGIISDTNWDIK